jgi:hypothetical protein
MRVRSGRAFEPRRREVLPLHAKLTRHLGERAAFPFSPWSRVARTASVLLGARLQPPAERRPDAARTTPLPPASERGEPASEPSSLDRDSVLPLELLAHPSVPAPAPAPQRTTPKPPRPQRVVLESDDDFASVAPPPLFSIAPSDAPLVASTAPSAEEPRSHRVAYRIASGALFLGFGVLGGWMLRGHTDAVEPLSGARPAALAAALAARAPDATPKSAPAERNAARMELPTPPLAQTQAPAATPTRVEVPVVTIVARAQPADSADDAASDAAPAPLVDAPESADLPGFDAEAARQSIAAAEARLSVCRGPSDPSGTATVIVRYAPSGRVTTATVESGPFVGTPAGGCIAATFRSSRVPPFAGDTVTVKRTVTLR